MMLTDNARTVLARRYLARDEQGRPAETAEELFTRVASAVAVAELLYDPSADTAATANIFYELMTSLRFLPNSPTLMNAGRPLGQLSACFVLPVGDSMGEIFDAVKQAALIHQSGGGTGFAFSRLRCQGSTVGSTGGVASGPVSFMRVFNAATEAVKQGGTRRGANMGILRVDHPDILEFIACKRDQKELTNFNISVGLTERFMRCVQNDETYELRNPNTGAVTASLRAREVFELIVSSAWHSGEPGIIFLDRVNRDNVVPSLGEIEATNPCGEQPLLPYESCNLGSVNLALMVRETSGSVEVDWELLAQTVALGVHFLDNVIDVNRYPLDMIAETTRATRKIGLGVMGWADMLLRLGLPYNSPEAVALGERLMAFITEKARDKSAELARARGPFPAFGQSTLDPSRPMRNATVTTIAPTGTLSILAGVSSGIEPVFAFVYERNIMDGTRMIEANPILQGRLEGLDLDREALLARIAEQGTLGHLEELPDGLRALFVSAHDIAPEWHIKMQAAFQKYTDNAVSKTVNFPHTATAEDVRRTFLLAYELGCKGVTIYRDRSREEQVLTAGASKPAEDPAAANPVLIQPRPRPAVTNGFTEKIAVGCGNLYITVNYDEQGICEVFTNTGKKGGCPSQSEATARLLTAALRSGVDPAYLLRQLRGIRCPSTVRQPGMSCTSCPDAIARVIGRVTGGGQDLPPSGEEPVGPDTARWDEGAAGGTRLCPECHSPIAHEGGCTICRQCGYSHCG